MRAPYLFSILLIRLNGRCLQRTTANDNDHDGSHTRANANVNALWTSVDGEAATRTCDGHAVQTAGAWLLFVSVVSIHLYHRPLPTTTTSIAYLPSGAITTTHHHVTHLHNHHQRTPHAQQRAWKVPLPTLSLPVRHACCGYHHLTNAHAMSIDCALHS